MEYSRKRYYNDRDDSMSPRGGSFSSYKSPSSSSSKYGRNNFKKSRHNRRSNSPRSRYPSYGRNVRYPSGGMRSKSPSRGGSARSPYGRRSRSRSDRSSRSRYGRSSRSPYSRSSKSPCGRSSRSPYGRSSRSRYGRSSRSPYGRSSESRYGSRSPYSRSSKSPYGRSSRSPYGRSSRYSNGKKGQRSPSYGRSAKSLYGRRSRSRDGKRSRSSSYDRESKSPRCVKRRRYIDTSPYNRKYQFPTSKRTHKNGQNSRSPSPVSARESLLNIQITDSSLFSELIKTKCKKEMKHPAEVFNTEKEMVMQKELAKRTEHSSECIIDISNSEKYTNSPLLKSVEEEVNIHSKYIALPIEECHSRDKTLQCDHESITPPLPENKLVPAPVKTLPLEIPEQFHETIHQQKKPELDLMPPYEVSNCSSIILSEGRIPDKSQIPMRRPIIMNRCEDGTFVRTNLKSKQLEMRSLYEYQIIGLLGEGVYGEVYKAKDNKTDELVALKKIKELTVANEFPINTLREVKLLNQLKHENIVNLKEVVFDKNNTDGFNNQDGSIYLVLEYMDHDLKGLLDSAMVKFSDIHNASIMKQLLKGLHYCHERNILHRDIKTCNILMNNRGQVKLADFGLAKQQNPSDKQILYTNNVVTFWYRCPELLLGERRYGPAIDVWSCGCILGELFLKKPMFRAEEVVKQLDLIYRVCGSATPDVWPSVVELPRFKLLNPEPMYRRKLKKVFCFIPPGPLDLLDKMLVLDPEKRITVEEALNSSWLQSINPERITPPELPNHQNCNKLLSRKIKSSNSRI